MKTLPDDISAYKRTPAFDKNSVPKGLLTDHNTKKGVWGKIVILEGELEHTILQPNLEFIILNPNKHGVVEPVIKHFIKPLGDVRFYVEFYR